MPHILLFVICTPARVLDTLISNGPSAAAFDGFGSIHTRANSYCCKLLAFLPAELRGHQVAVWAELAGIAVHSAHQLLPTRFVGHDQFVEYLVQLLHDGREHRVMGGLLQGRSVSDL